MKVIEKKILNEYYREIICEDKLFEIRKEDDVKYEKNDLLVLRLWDNEKEEYVDDEYVVCQITYVLRGFEGLADGYVALSLKVFNVF